MFAYGLQEVPEAAAGLHELESPIDVVKAAQLVAVDLPTKNISETPSGHNNLLKLLLEITVWSGAQLNQGSG